MKILTAEEFAAKVMENGTEIEFDSCKSMNREDGEAVWVIFAHIDEDRNLVRDVRDAEWAVTADMVLTAEQSEALMNGDLDDMEKAVIINDLYPQYIKIMEEED